MTPLIYNENAAYRMDHLKGQATTRRMVNAAKATAMPRRVHSLRGTLGNGLIALGSKLTEPPSAEDFDLNRAA